MNALHDKGGVGRYSSIAEKLNLLKFATTYLRECNRGINSFVRLYVDPALATQTDGRSTILHCIQSILHTTSARVVLCKHLIASMLYDLCVISDLSK